MFRNLKVLLAAALALTAFGAIAASAHAEDEFHCSANPCRGTLSTDGTGKEAHHVFIIENAATTESVSFTCESLRGDLEFAGNVAKEVTLTSIAYDNCTANGSAGVIVDMNGCDYRFTGAGGRSEDKAEVHVECPEGKQIEITYNGCIATVTPLRATGIGYTTKGVSPNREVTATVNHVTIPAERIHLIGTKAQCLISVAEERKLVGTYTTGNTLITGETTAGVMADAWYE